MVATIQVLAGTPTTIAEYFTHERASEYYAAERNGIWFGQAAERLGLRGQVERQEFESILGGMSPAGKRITRKWSKPQSDQATQQKRCPGYDLTFSVPKSVSILWSLSEREDRQRIEDAVERAVRKTLFTLEEVVPLGRRGRGGKEQVHGKIAAAFFTHFTNREQEQQIHVHAVVANCLLGSDGKWSAVNSRLLHYWTPALGRIFRCELGKELSQNLGVALCRPITADGKLASWFEVKGIPKPFIDACSSRRKAIEAAVNGDGSNLGKSDAKARERANLKTRKKKGKTPQLGELLDEWKKSGSDFGLDAEAVQRFYGNEIEAPLADVYAKAFREAVETLTETEAHFAARDVVLRVCEELQHLGVDGREITKQVTEDLEHRPDIVQLASQAGERRYTTQEMWATEASLLADIDEIKTRRGNVVAVSTAARVVGEFDSLSSEQATAALELMTKDGGVRILSGVAGAGKSFTLNAVREGFERSGCRVIGGAIAGAAKEELVRQTAIESRTVASYLFHLEKTWLQRAKERVTHDARQIIRAAQGKRTFKPDHVTLGKNTVIIIDEAGMVGTRTLARLVRAVKKAGSTLILCGDPHQLNPIEAGTPTKSIAANVGASRLTTNRRQVKTEDRRAVAAIRTGDAAAAIASYAGRGLVSLGRDRHDAIDQLVDSWGRSGGRNRPQDHMVFVQTKAEAALVNKLCQRERLRSRRGDARRSIQYGSARYHVGDRVMFNKPFRQKFLENGYRGTVISVAPRADRISVRLDQEPSDTARARGASRVVTLSKRDVAGSGMGLGFAATTHKLQGQTVANSYLLLCSGITSREMAYTQATRGKHVTRLFTDELTAGDDLKDLIRAVGKSRAKQLAHVVGRRPAISAKEPYLQLEVA